MGEALQCLRFVNSDMYYSDEELESLQQALIASPFADRVSFFAACQRLRRRERVAWSDTPLAQVLTPPRDWPFLRAETLK